MKRKFSLFTLGVLFPRNQTCLNSFPFFEDRARNRPREPQNRWKRPSVAPVVSRDQRKMHNFFVLLLWQTSRGPLKSSPGLVLILFFHNSYSASHRRDTVVVIIKKRIFFAVGQTSMKRNEAVTSGFLTIQIFFCWNLNNFFFAQNNKINEKYVWFKFFNFIQLFWLNF